MNKKFVQDGNNIFIFEFDESFAKDKLPAAIYTVVYNPLQGFFLQKNKDSFDVSSKTYGTLNSRALRIINTYQDRTASTGILLTGLKGSGKTLLSQIVSNKMIEQGLPVVLVENSFSGDAFISFLNKIGECVLIFDEFAKVFEAEKQNQKDQQNGLLGIFDGNKSIKRLIFVIENEIRNLNEFYKNRPGRLFYHFEYSRLEELVIDEYCEDKKIKDKIKTEIKSAYYRIRNFSFDILKAIVDEHIRYPEDSILNIVDILNIDTDSYVKTFLNLSRVINKKNDKPYEYHSGPKEIVHNKDLNIQIFLKEKGKNIPENSDEYELADQQELELIYIRNYNIIFESEGKVAFEDKDRGFILEFDKITKSSYNYLAF